MVKHEKRKEGKHTVDELLKIVLSSSLLVGIVSAVVSLFNNKKNNNLKYITEDRRRWREEIRNIVDELENTNYYNRNKILQRLKVRINPYGKNDNKISHDSHIWDVIGEIENASCDKEFREKKEQLVLYLSFLLKYDWERTKKEVSGNWKVLGLLVTFLIGLLFLIYKHFIECGYEYNELFLITTMVFLMLPVVLGTCGFEMLFKELWNENKTKIKKYIFRGILIVGSIIFVICIYVALPIYVLKSYRITLVNLISGKGYGELSLVIAIVMILYYLTKSLTTQSVKGKYIDAIKECLKSTETDNQSK